MVWNRGYLAVTTTGILRIYNSRYWFRDILPGACFGILSTKLVYWMYPAIKRKFFKDKPTTTMIMSIIKTGKPDYQ